MSTMAGTSVKQLMKMQLKKNIMKKTSCRLHALPVFQNLLSAMTVHKRSNRLHVVVNGCCLLQHHNVTVYGNKPLVLLLLISPTDSKLLASKQWCTTGALECSLLKSSLQSRLQRVSILVRCWCCRLELRRRLAYPLEDGKLHQLRLPQQQQVCLLPANRTRKQPSRPKVITAIPKLPLSCVYKYWVNETRSMITPHPSQPASRNSRRLLQILELVRQWSHALN